MILRITGLWIAGGLIIIPYSIYHLLVHAQRDKYAFLIIVPLFWLFGFWGVVGPLIAAWKVRKLMKALEQAGDKQELMEAYERNEGEAMMVDLIASENRVPRFIARRIYRLMADKIRKNYSKKRGP